MSFEETSFSSNPNFLYIDTITDKSDCLSDSYNFDCFVNKTGETLLFYPYFDVKAQDHDYHIGIINLNEKGDNKEVGKLLGHKDRVICIRYFRDPFTNKDYLISSDKKYVVIVWDLDDNYKKIMEVETKYEGFIYSCYLIFEQNQKFAVTISLGSNAVTKVYDVDHKDKVTEIAESKNLAVYYVDYWFNKNGNDGEKHIIIQCGKNKVLMSAYPKNTTYLSIETTEKFPYILNGLRFKNKDKDYFAFAATYGLIKIIEFETKQEVFKYEGPEKLNCHFNCFVKWNDRYLLLKDCAQRQIVVFDMDDGYKVKSKCLCPEDYFEKFMKKVKHPKYGESLLSLGIDWKIKLFSNRNIIPPKTN